MDLIQSLPLFPLSDVVLLPGLSVPLFIFEPRYRQMTRDALAGSRQIGMVTVRPDSLELMAGDAPIFDIGCLGRIARAQERPDGTFQILLLGKSRIRILSEQEREEERLYRSAHVELLCDREARAEQEIEAEQQARSTLLTLLERLVERSARDEDHARTFAGFARLAPAPLVNALTQSISFHPIERQQLLEADSITSRFEIMADLLRFRLAETGASEPGTRPLLN
ncbi:MAG: hypothetical protein CL908_16375 [Deltaproteobacteria bacterium]|nr:hypothetical protein [Deltaproteobacteria bacterium]